MDIRAFNPEYTTILEDTFMLERRIGRCATIKHLWGPKLWSYIHMTTFRLLSETLPPETLNEWYDLVLKMIPCTTCQTSFWYAIRKVKGYTQPLLFNYFVDYHNKINSLLGKTTMSYIEAYNLWEEKYNENLLL